MKLGKRLPATESVVDEDVDPDEDVDEDVDSDDDDDDDVDDDDVDDADVLPHRRALPGECACVSRRRRCVFGRPSPVAASSACGLSVGGA